MPAGSVHPFTWLDGNRLPQVTQMDVVPDSDSGWA